MPRKKGPKAGSGALSSASAASADAANSEHKSVPDRGVPEAKARDLRARHDKLCFSLSACDEEAAARVRRVDLVPDRPDYLVLYRGLFSPAECASIVGLIDAVGLNEASKADINPRKGEAYLDRENATFEHEGLAGVVWRRLTAAGLPDVDGRPAKGLFHKLRYYCYRKGQRFDQHVDTFVKDGEGDISEYTLLIYLNSSAGNLAARASGGGGGGGGGGGAGADAALDDDDEAAAGLPPLSGGATVFYATAKKVLASVEPEAGAAVIHAHGRRCLMHEGSAVDKGAKYVLRSDILYHKAS